jgi:hypothetical protein
MREYKKILSVLILLTSLTACQSSGRTYAQLEKDGIPPIAEDKGRVFLYRYSTLGFAIQPSIFIDDNKVGDSVAEGFFFTDIPPGKHRVSAETEVEKTLDFTVAEKQNVYIKQSPAFGLFIGRIAFDNVEETQAKSEMAELHYQGDVTKSETEQKDSTEGKK